MMKRFLTTLCITCLSISLCAQEQEKHEFTIGGSLGFSSMKLSINSLMPTGGVAIGYNYFFNDIVGASTGLGWSLYQWKTALNPFTDSYPTHDDTEPFVLHSSFTDYVETQNASCLIIPLAIRFQYPLFSDDFFTYFSIGGKAGFPLRSKYKTSETTFTTSAYYPAYDVLLESPKSRGLGTFTGDKQIGDYPMRTMWMLNVEAGMKWDFSAQFSLYGGLSFDYSLNGVNSAKGKQFLIYDPNNPTNYTFNSILNSQYTEGGQTKNFVARANPISLSIVIRVAYRIPD